MPDIDREQLKKRFDEIHDRLPSVLEELDRERFYRLSRDPKFVRESKLLYLRTTRFKDMIGPGPQLTEGVDPEAYLDDLAEFGRRYRTWPISIFLLLDESEIVKDDVDLMKRSLEKIWDGQGKTETIKVYPWTRIKDVQNEFDRIRKRQKKHEINSKDVIIGYRALALKNAKWAARDIADYLDNHGPKNIAYRRAIEAGKSPDQAREASEDVGGHFGRTDSAASKRYESAVKQIEWFCSEFS